MDNKEFKRMLRERILNRPGIYSRSVYYDEIVTRCPSCGDSKDKHKGHLYIHIDPTDDSRIVFHCFKCPYGYHTYMTYEDLVMLGIEGDDIREGINQLNKTSIYTRKQRLSDEVFEYTIPPVNDCGRKISYLENRIGTKLDINELEKLKVITSLSNFLRHNNISTITCKPEMANILERDYIGFLSNNNAYILFRDITEKNYVRWLKYPITHYSKHGMKFYSIASQIDVFSDQDIIINLSEGVMDCISIWKNLEYSKVPNCINIAAGGKYYKNIIDYLIGMGFIGDNIIMNIFADRDYTDDTSVEYFRKTLGTEKMLVKEINVIYNTLSKDCGVSRENILLDKNTI